MLAKRAKIIGILQNTSIDTTKYDARFGNFSDSKDETIFKSKFKEQNVCKSFGNN